MADNEYDILLRTRREGDAAKQEAQDQQQLAAALEKTAAAAKSATAALGEQQKLTSTGAGLATPPPSGTAAPSDRPSRKEDFDYFEKQLANRVELEKALAQINGTLAAQKAINAEVAAADESRVAKLLADQQAVLDGVKKEIDANTKNASVQHTLDELAGKQGAQGDQEVARAKLTVVAALNAEAGAYRELAAARKSGAGPVEELAATNKVIDATKARRLAQSDLDQTLIAHANASAGAAGASNQFSAAAAGVAGSAQSAATSVRGLTTAGGLMARALTGAAIPFRALFSGFTVAVAVAVGEFFKMKSVIDSFKMDGAISTFSHIEEGIRKMKDTMAEASTQAAVFQASLQQILTAPVSDSAKADREITLIREREQAEIQSLDKVKSLKEAQLAAEVEAGVASKREEVGRKLALEQEYVRQKAAIENKADEGALAVRKQLAVNAATTMRVDLVELAKAQDRDAKARSKVDFAQSKVEDDEEAIRTARARAESDRQKSRDLNSQADTSLDPFVRKELRKQAGLLDEDAEQQVGIEQGAKRALAVDKKQLYAAQAAAAEYARQLQVLEQRLTESAKVIHDVGQSLPTEQAKVAFDEQIRKIFADIDQQVAAASAAGQLAGMDEKQIKEFRQHILEARYRAMGITPPPNLGQGPDSKNPLPPGYTEKDGQIIPPGKQPAAPNLTIPLPAGQAAPPAPDVPGMPAGAHRFRTSDGAEVDAAGNPVGGLPKPPVPAVNPQTGLPQGTGRFRMSDGAEINTQNQVIRTAEEVGRGAAAAAKAGDDASRHAMAALDKFSSAASAISGAFAGIKKRVDDLERSVADSRNA